jgi:hypothetical protein
VSAFREVRETSGSIGATIGIVMPSVVNAGDYLVVGCTDGTGNLPFTSGASGWTAWTQDDLLGPGIETWYKVAAGTEAGTTVSFPARAASGTFAAACIRYDFNGVDWLTAKRDSTGGAFGFSSPRTITDSTASSATFKETRVLWVAAGRMSPQQVLTSATWSVGTGTVNERVYIDGADVTLVAADIDVTTSAATPFAAVTITAAGDLHWNVAHTVFADETAFPDSPEEGFVFYAPDARTRVDVTELPHQLGGHMDEEDLR